MQERFKMQALWRMFIRYLMLKSKKTGEKLNAERFKQNMAQDSLVAADMKFEYECPQTSKLA